MNTIGARDSGVSPEHWEGREMREALAERDVSAVYRLLRKVGVSQRQIAVLTSQSQSEVSEILKGRQVMAYDVLVRIANGLGIPQGYMGLAYDENTAALHARRRRELEPSGTPESGSPSPEEEDVKRRNFLAHAAAVTMGAVAFGPESAPMVASAVGTPTPNNIGLTDVKQIEAATKSLRALDYQYGGGTCRDAVLAQVNWSQNLLRASVKPVAKQRLFRALADLHNLAGWTSFDTGLKDSSRFHFARALEFAKHGEDHALVSNVLYHVGRLYLHYDEPNEALKMFQLGQIAAQDSGSQLCVAVLCANEAWAYAKMRDPAQAMRMIGRAKDEFARANRDGEIPSWVKFFDTNEIYGVTGEVHQWLASFEEYREKHAPLAVNATLKSCEGVDSTMQRSHVFWLSTLATNHIRAGDLQHGLKVGEDALRLGAPIKSQRIADRMAPLQKEAALRKSNADAQDLARRIAQYRGVA